MDKRNLEIILNARDQASATIARVAGEVRTLGSSAGEFLKGAMATATRATLIAGTAIGVFGGFALKSASQVEMLRANFDTMLGSAEKGRELFGKLQKMANVTPFETTDLADASKTLLAFGTDVKDLMPNLQMLGDVSLGNREKFKSLALVFGQISSNGHLMGQDLLQLVNQGFNPLQIISEKTGESMSSLREKMSKGQISFQMVSDAFKDATSKGGQFYQGMEKGSQTLSGQLSTLKDNVMIAAREFLGMSATGDIVKGSFFDKVKGAVAGLNDKLKDFPKVMDNLKKKFGEVADKIKPFIQPLIDFAKQHAGQIKQFLISFGIALAVLIPTLAAVAGIIAVFSNPLVLIALAIGVLVGLFIAFKQQIMDFYNSALVPLWNFLVAMFKPSLEALWSTFTQRLLPAIMNLWNALMPGLWTAIKVIAVIIGAVVVAAIWVFINVLNVVISVISFVINIIANLIRWFGNLIGAVVNAVMAIIGWFSRLPGNVANIVNGIVSWFRSLPDRIMGGISSLAGRFVGFFSSIGNGARNAVVGAVNGISGAVRGPINWVIDKVNGLINSFNKLPGPDIPNIPRLAQGTDFFQGGMAMVGENGPELVSLPRGSKVFNAQRTQNAGNQTTASFYGDIYLGDAGAVREFFDKLGRNQELAQQGLTTLR